MFPCVMATEVRKRGRRSKIDSSEHVEEIFHLLMEQRWGADSVARYLELKYGEEIPPGSLRTWRKRRREELLAEGTLPEAWADDPEPGDQTAQALVRRAMSGDGGIPDVLQRRFALIRLQEARIKLDADHEFSMGKQFVSQGKEIDLLNRLYNDVKRDMQDLGFWPKDVPSAPSTVVNAYGGAAVAASQARSESKSEVSASSLEELLDGVDVEAMREVGAVMRELGATGGSTGGGQ